MRASPLVRALAQRTTAPFEARFWDAERGHLADVVDVDHEAGRVDASFRPDQTFAVGDLPFALLKGIRARRVVDAVEARLLTPLGLRSLAPGEAGYTPRDCPCQAWSLGELLRLDRVVLK